MNNYEMEIKIVIDIQGLQVRKEGRRRKDNGEKTTMVKS